MIDNDALDRGIAYCCRQLEEHGKTGEYMRTLLVVRQVLEAMKAPPEKESACKHIFWKEWTKVVVCGNCGEILHRVEAPMSQPEGKPLEAINRILAVYEKWKDRQEAKDVRLYNDMIRQMWKAIKTYCEGE